jgi:hypothetical protein
MAITNAQQFKQLVNPPMKGNKRPGYRGDAAAASAAASGNMGGRSDPGSGADLGDGKATGAPSIEMINEIRRQNLEKAPDVKEKTNKFNILNFAPGGKYSLTGLAVRGLTSLFGPTKTKDTVEMYGPKGKREGPMAPGRDITEEDDDDNMGNGDGQSIFLPPLMAQAPSIVEQEPVVEEEEPFEFYRRFRAEGGIMNNDVVGGEFDFDSARQMYGLGKLVKKITRSVKKIAKSPIGKVAIAYGLTGGLSNLAAGKSFGANFFSPTSFISKGGIRNIFTKEGLSNIAFGAPGKFMGPVSKGYMTPGSSGIFGSGGELSPLKAIAGVSALSGLLTAEQEEEAQLISDETGIDIAEIRANPDKYLARRFRAEGGSMDEPVAKKTMPLLDMGGKEMDLRAEGGFVPIGRMEKADDVPARLSKNEFVFTAEAVRNAGEGDVDKGAEVMYNMMKNLESGGDVSEESQGLDGARKMFQTSQRLEEVL